MPTGAKLRAIRPKSALYRVTDGDGLAVEGPISGALRWRYRYRFEGKAKKLSLGVYPVVSLAQARFRRNAAKVQLAHGMGPGEHRQTAKQAKVEALTKAFMR